MNGHIDNGITASDPTITHAGLTEMNGTNAQDAIPTAMDGPLPLRASDADGSLQAGVSDFAANNGATEWSAATIAESDPVFENVTMIPRDPSETLTGIQNNVTVTSSQSWADEPVPASSFSAVESLNNGAANDGFHEVHHHSQHRGRGRGGDRARGRGGRGRGGRGRAGRGARGQVP